jgi:hypothetical protein
MSDVLNKASLVMIPSGYKEDVVYSQIPTDGSGDLTFTRASNATRVNSAGLIEKVRTNFILQSNQFDTTWVSINTTETSGASDFDGGNNAWTLAKSTSGGKITQNVSGLPGLHCFSVYAKAGTLDQIALETANFFTVFNLNTGVVVSGNGVIQSVGGGWYRCSITDTPSSNGFTIYPAPTADASGNIIIYKSQVETGDIATDYIETTTAAVSVGMTANVPRLDYSQGSCPSLLLEKQSTNLALYSEQLDNAAWTKSQGFGGTLPIITKNYGISPDGTQNADRIQLTRTTDTSSYSYVYQNLVVSVGVSYTWSVWLKSLSGTPSVALVFDGSNYANIVTLTTEWQRYTFTTNSTDTSIQATFLLFANLSGTSLTADFLAWGAQVEAGSYATSYIPTTSASATRVADACSKTGISSLIGQTEGTLFVEAANLFPSGSRTIGLLYTSGSAYYQIYMNSSNEVRVDVNGSLIFLGGSIAANTNYKIAFAYKSGEYALYINGTQIATSTSTTMPSSLTDYYLGNALGSEQSGVYSQALLFKTRLSNTELASLTNI